MENTIVLMLCAMRSGSTLLKALLGAAPDVSHMGEVDFQEYCEPEQFEKLQHVGGKRIQVLKKPAFLTEYETYPRVPPFPCKKIVLYRNVYDTILSLTKMMIKTKASMLSELTYPRMVDNYFCPVYTNIYKNKYLTSQDTVLVHYEELIRNPLEVTKGLFEFIGSSSTEGVRTYGKPKGSDWVWGKDDGGPLIRTMEVQEPENLDKKDPLLLEAIARSGKVYAVERMYQYPMGRFLKAWCPPPPVPAPAPKGKP